MLLRVPNPLPGPQEYNFGARLVRPFGVIFLHKGAASILDPKAGSGTGDSFGVMVALLSELG